MAAPKNNRFAAGHGFGRPKVYETPEEMYKNAQEYFEMETSSGGVCKPTISGLMFHLGFTSRTSFYNYKERSPEFKDLCNQLILFIESCYEKNLHGFTWAGSAFALRNINSKDWKDETTQNQNVTNVTAKFGSDTIHTAPQSEENT